MGYYAPRCEIDPAAKSRGAMWVAAPAGAAFRAPARPPQIPVSAAPDRNASNTWLAVECPEIVGCYLTTSLINLPAVLAACQVIVGQGVIHYGE